MIKEITLLGALLSATMPLNAPLPNVSKEFMNSTEYNIVVGGEAPINAHSSETLIGSQAYWTDSYIYVTANSKPNDVYYWINEADNEQEVLITFSEIPVPNTYVFDLPDLSSDTIQGIQFFQKTSLVGETFYLVQPTLSNVNLSSGNILEGATATIGNRSLTSLTWTKQQMSSGLMAYGYYQANGTTFASNSKVSNPTDFNQLTNTLLYRGDWSNVVTYTSGYYPRVWNVQGRNETPSGFLSKIFVGYATLTSANDIDTTLVPLETGFNIVGLVIEAMNSVFTWQVLPGLTIGVLFLIPTIVLIVLALLKLIKKG